MDEEKVTLWKQRMTSFQSSGLSIKKWCRENHIVPTQAHHIAMSWKELHFEIASKEEADLVAYFIRQLQASC